MRAGYSLTVYNRSPEKAEELGDAGAIIAKNPAEVAAESTVIFTMLPGPPEVREVISGGEGVFRGAREGTLIVDMSTSSPALARELSKEAGERGVAMLDAPVSGGDVGAIAGTLSIMVGGDESDFERAKPLFDVMGDTVIHAGPSGAGQTAKATNQIVVALVIQAVSEGIVLGARGGGAPERVLDVLSGGLAANQVIEVKREKFLGHDFEPGGKVEFHRKDLGIALETARDYGVVLPVTSLVNQMFEALVARGRGGWDHSALLTLVEECSQRGAGRNE